MENSLEGIIIAFGIMMFCTGAALFLMQNKEVNRLIDKQQKIIYQNNTIIAD